MINELKERGVITDEQKRRVQASAFVRNKATHADWSGFSLEGVDDTIRLTKELISQHLK